MAGLAPEIEILGINSMKIMTRKYKLVSFENYANKFFGKNVTIEYLDVFISLSFRSNGKCSVPITCTRRNVFDPLTSGTISPFFGGC